MTTINLPNSTGIIGNLTVNTALTLNRLFIEYGVDTTIVLTNGVTTTLKFPTMLQSVNASGLTIDSTFSNFTNTSGLTKTWFVATQSGLTASSTSGKYGLIVQKNGANIMSHSTYIPASTNINISVTVPVIMNNNDYITIKAVNSTGTDCNVAGGEIYISEV